MLGDRLRLEQVLSNLIDNAVKFSPPDKPVEVSLRPNGSNRYWLAVRDFGAGIPIEHRERVFERFHRAHDGDYNGVGLGLHICKEIVRLHGGEIAIEDPAGGGTQMVVSLPAG